MGESTATRSSQLFISPASIGFLRLFLKVLVVVMVLLAAQSLWINHFALIRIWDNTAIIAVATVALLLLRKHRVRLAVVVTLWGTWAIVCTSIWLHLGLHNPAVLSFPLFLMLNGWLLGKGQAVGMAIATGALLFTLAALEQNGYHTWQAHPSVWLLASTTSAILVLGVLISTGMANSIQTQYQELSELSRTLEQRVQERTAELSATVERLKQTQLDLVQSEKMAALGSLVAGVSHELNTPIGNGLTVASTMQHQVEEFATSLGLGLTRSALDRFVANIREGADILMVSLRRAAALVSSFKQVAVDQTSENRREFGLRETVNEILLTLGPTIRKTSHMVTSAIPDGILMESYPGPLGQVLTNLIHNALTHGLESRSCGQIHLHAVKTHSDWVQLTVHDDGSGISAEHMSRVFDPFFTTRLGRGGSGLGLSIVYNIVTQTLGGSIRAESTPGHGASFILDIPLAAPSTPER